MYIQRLQEVRSQLAALQADELELMNSIIKEAGHKKLGQATYDMDGAKVTIVTKDNVTLDKARLNAIWTDKMPINRKYDYDLRKKDFDALMQNGTAAQRKLLAQIVTTKPARPSVKISTGE